MIHFSFVQIDSLNADLLSGLGSRYELEGVIFFDSVDELNTFFKLYGAELKVSPFAKLSEITQSWLITDKFKTFSESDFEAIYQTWLDATGRDNNMDKFGQLICFNGSVNKLNQAKHLAVL